MAQVGSQLSARVVALLSAPDIGLNTVVAQLSEAAGILMPAFAREQLKAQNIAAEIAEKSAGASYPAVHIYCERVSNTLREKFRAFSGTARMVMEARVSQDRLEGLEQKSQLMADAMTNVLDASRGDWGMGAFYTGGYDVTFGPVRHGGRNYLQITKVVFDVDVSAN
jgi:hypothetical protein